jgi:hypothetical protein
MHTRLPQQMPMRQGSRPQRPTGWSKAPPCLWLIWLLIALLPRVTPAQSPAAPARSSPEAVPPTVPLQPAQGTPAEPPADREQTDQPPPAPVAQPPATESATPLPATTEENPNTAVDQSSAAAEAELPAAVPSQPGIPTAAPANTNQPAADGTVSVVIAPTETPSSPPAAMTPPTATALPTNRALVSPPADQPEKTAATQLLEHILEPVEHVPATAGGTIDHSLLYARPLPLLEALQRSGDRSRRLWITQAYWKVSAGYAGIRFAGEALDQLQLVAPGGDPHDQAVLDVAIAAAEADLAAAHAELIAAQQQLADLVRLPIGEPPPWPVDRPLAGAYQTHFAAIFATRPATGRIRAIDRMLPSKHAAVEARATALLAAQAAMLRAESDHARGKRPIEAVIAAHRMLQQQQHGFIDSLAAYNLDIAEYAMAVADVSVPDDRYVSMLIGTPIQWAPQPAQSVVPAAGLQPVDPQQVTLPRK